MRRDEEEELAHLRAVLAQLTGARRKAEWLLEAARGRVAYAGTRRPADGAAARAAFAICLAM